MTFYLITDFAKRSSKILQQCLNKKISMVAIDKTQNIFAKGISM